MCFTMVHRLTSASPETQLGSLEELGRGPGAHTLDHAVFLIYTVVPYTTFSFVAKAVRTLNMDEQVQKQAAQLDELPIPSPALHLLLKSLPAKAKNTLLLCNSSTRQDILMKAECLRFKPGAHVSERLIKQLCPVLHQRKEPLKLELDMDESPAGAGSMASMLSAAAATSRPMHEARGAQKCCVEELVMKKTSSAQGWGGLLGAAFPNITTLQLPLFFQLDVQLLAGLAACTRLTTLKLGLGAGVPPEVCSSAHLLPNWLPHVHSLECDGVCNGGLALVRGLAGQLQHVKLWRLDDQMGAALAACKRLISITLDDMDQPVLDALIPLPQLREVDVKFYVDLRHPAPAQWGVTTLSLPSLKLDQVPCLPLASVRKLSVRGSLHFTLQPTPAQSAAAIRTACTTLAAVPQLELKDSTLMIFNSVRDGPCDSQMEDVLGALQPLAATLGPSLTLVYQRAQDGARKQLGPEVLRGLHAAFGDSLTQLTINMGDNTQYRWLPAAEFWREVSAGGVLLQLQKLELFKTAAFDHESAVVLGMACKQLQLAGRQFELVFWRPLEKEDELQGIVRALQELQPLVRVSMED